VITTVDPEVTNVIVPGLYLPFVGLVFIASWISMYLVFKSITRSLMWSLITCFYLLLRFIDLAALLNGMLLVSIGLVGEYFLRQGDKSSNSKRVD
jgi:hypothetical protein